MRRLVVDGTPVVTGLAAIGDSMCTTNPTLGRGLTFTLTGAVDLLETLHEHRGDWTAQAKSVLRVDGGMVASDWTMQFLADMLDAPVERPTIGETTALGVAWLAGHKAGVWPDADSPPTA